METIGTEKREKVEKKPISKWLTKDIIKYTSHKKQRLDHYLQTMRGNLENMDLESDLNRYDSETQNLDKMTKKSFMQKSNR